MQVISCQNGQLHTDTVGEWNSAPKKSFTTGLNALDELLTQSNANDEREAEKILQGGSLQIAEYEPRTNGFIFTAHSPDNWFHPGERYVAEYIQSRTNSVLKINGAIFFENDIKE